MRTVSREYLVAMKLMSGRKYKNDLSDIIGILYEEQENGTPIYMNQIETAVCNLYDSWENLPQDSRDFINDIMNNHNLENLYNFYRTNELSTKEALIDFEQKYPAVVTTDNVNEIIKQLHEKKKNS